MSTATELFTDITELPDFEASPPCGTMFVNRVTKHEFPCGKPAVIRMHMRCPSCARARTVFLCQLCYDDLHRQKLTCWYCYTQGVSKPVVGTVREM